MKKISITLFCILACCVTITYFALKNANSYQLDGEISIDALDQAVTIHRDKYGIPYIFADNIRDAIRTQGFVVAQDRIFQVEMYRAIIEGRLASILGESGLNSDIKMRVLGIRKNAERHAGFLDEESTQYLSWYAEGYNAFVDTRAHEYPLEMSALNIKPRHIDVVDLLSVQHFAGFIQGRNYEDEILSLNLTNELGTEKARELSPLNINPDRKLAVTKRHNKVHQYAQSNDYITSPFSADTQAPVALPASGSNNWVSGSSKSQNNLPILVNDPHLDASILPGPWYPVGIFTDKISAVGANLPGVPGIMLGRTKYLSFGITNAYGDSQDLYIETIDEKNEGHYFNGNLSTPFEIETINIAVKDNSAKQGYRDHELIIRRTLRGPVISDHSVFGIDSRRPIVLRTAAAEITSNSIGFPDVLTANTVQEADAALSKIDVFYMNYIFADINGGIGHRPTGAIPIRENGTSAKVATGIDDWTGTIPKADMPGQINPSKDWLATSNHDVIPDNYPYYYSTHFSPNYRYLRSKEWLNKEVLRTSKDHWKMLADVKNKHAEKLVPIFLDAISSTDDLSDLHKELQTWNFNDDTESVAATIFHLTHEYLVRLMYENKMSDNVFEHFLKSRYYWMQKTDALIESGHSDWFDIYDTEKIETLQDLIISASLKAKEALTRQLGSNKNKWKWGDYHKVTFVSPLRQSGFGMSYLGGGTHRASGSGETLNRGQYSLNKGPYESKWISSLRMVADMSDNEKIMGSISGGSASRQFHPYFKSQLNNWLNEEWAPWWLDRNKAEEHSVHKLTLTP